MSLSNDLVLLYRDKSTLSWCTARSGPGQVWKLIRHQGGRTQSSMAIVDTKLNQTWHMNTYTYLDPSSLILRFAPRMAPGIKLLYNFANWNRGSVLWTTTISLKKTECNHQSSTVTLHELPFQVKQILNWRQGSDSSIFTSGLQHKECCLPWDET